MAKFEVENCECRDRNCSATATHAEYCELHAHGTCESCEKYDYQAQMGYLNGAYLCGECQIKANSYSKDALDAYGPANDYREERSL